MKSNQFPTHSPKKGIKYGLFEADRKLMVAEYPLLVWEKNRLSKQGIRMLKIKPVKE